MTTARDDTVVVCLVVIDLCVIFVIVMFAVNIVKSKR